MNEMVAHNLKSIRSISEFTQEEVASALGITRSAYSNYESGEREMPLPLLEKAADLFGCELYLFFEEELPKDMALAAAFRIKDFKQEDLPEMMRFKEIVKSYIKMDQLIRAL
ncbi:MAG: helix-turn-helix transcriptional regulator [Prevotellaceae bacterium]|jgi:transcriptional regulator with XRE-family HTH domain|nr:helix-turn-helix transcriptional regulator [Prevotellaceae bacterium]